MDTVTLELRRRISSCNAFIRLNKRSSSNPIDVKLNEDLIEIRVGKETRKILLPSCKIIPATLSTLHVSETWISFRIQIKPANSLYGSFGTEIIGTSSSENTSSKDSGRDLSRLKNTPCALVCTCCKNILTKEVSFERILPLPNLDCDPGEWFCCKHSENEDYVNILQPKEVDYFYGPYFCLLNKWNFNTDIKSDKRSIICSRCLSILGVEESKDTIKLWNCCFDCMAQDGANLLCKASDPVEDFTRAVKDVLDSFQFGEILLESAIGKRTQFALVRVMEKDLDVLVEEGALLDGVARLQKISVMKVLYKYGEDVTNVNFNGNNIHHRQVAFSVLQSGLEYLLASTKRYPHSYRTVDGYFIGFLNVTMFHQPIAVRNKD